MRKVVNGLARAGLGLMLLLVCPAQAQGLRVAAASNLKFVLAELESRYRAQGGSAVEFSWGSSVHLARQIQQGLPVQLFISADEAQVAWLAQAGMTLDAGQRYALGRLAMISLKSSAI
ncbi:MAG: substrate-binding domain-containing protein, partial [Limnohabitans sp.]